MLFPLSIATCLMTQFFRKTYRKQYRVHNKGIIVVTGASTGIGNHAALSLGKDGYEVYAGVRTKQEYDDITATASRLNIPSLQPLYLDVTDHESCIAAILLIQERMTESGLPLVALVNNAGIMTTSPVEFHAVADARRVFNTNFFSILDLVQLALPALKKSHGRVVNIASMVAIAAPPLQGIYAASKAATKALTDSLRRELQPFPVSVSLVEPAYVATELLSTATVSSTTAIASNKTSKNPSLESDNREAVIKEAKQEYAHLYSRAVEREIEKNVSLAETPECTTWAITHAINSPTPRTTYPVSNAAGIPSWLLVLAFAILPDRFVDTQVGPIHT